MNPFLSRALRYGGDALELGRTFAQPMVGEIPAGLQGLGTMMRTGDMDQAAEDVESTRRDFEYAPTRPGTQRAVEKIGQGVEFTKDLWNAQKGAPAIAEGWDKFVTTAPGIAAAATGIAGVVDPTHGGGKAATASYLTSDEDMIDPSFPKIMENYETRLPKEIEKYLKKHGAKIEDDKMLPTGAKTQEHAATGKRIRFTPELLAEILRGQELYQILGGAGLLGLAASQGEEQPQL